MSARPTPHEILWELLRGFIGTRALAVAVDLSVADELEAGPLPVDELAGPNEPDDAKWVDLVMLALVRGRERTEAEWRLLLAESGFEVEHVGEDLVQAFARA